MCSYRMAIGMGLQSELSASWRDERRVVLHAGVRVTAGRHSPVGDSQIRK